MKNRKEQDDIDIKFDNIIKRVNERRKFLK